jgi:hypothetical protein
LRKLIEKPLDKAVVHRDRIEITLQLNGNSQTSVASSPTTVPDSRRDYSSASPALGDASRVRLGASLARMCRDHQPEMVHLAQNRFVSDTALRPQIFNVAEAQSESKNTARSPAE